MAGPQAVWGIEIGRCALKAVKLRPGTDGKVELVAHDYVEHARILSQPDANKDELISNALEKFLSHNDLSRDQVVVSVPGQHTLARFTKLPPVAEKKIPDIVRYEADQQIPFDMDEVIWDYQTFQREDLPDVEVGIFAMKRELIRGHLLHFEQASIEPIAVQCVPLAVYNACHYEGLIGEGTTIMLDIGAESTDLIIGTKDSLWTRTIAIGGNSFTEALVKSFKLSFSKAENLKRTASTSKYARQVFQAMRPVFAELVQELQRSIGFYSSTHRDADIRRVVGVGNSFKLPGLQKYLQQNLGLDVVRPEKMTMLAETPGAAAPQFTSEVLSFFVPYGLALQGLELSRVSSSLLPLELAKQVVWRKKQPTFAAAAACILVAGGLIWFRQSTDARALEENSVGASNASVSIDEAQGVINATSMVGPSPRADAMMVQQAASALKSQLSQLTGQGELEREQTRATIRHLEHRWLVPDIMAMIHRAVPHFDNPLSRAGSAEEARAALEQIRTPRAERKQIVIEAVNMDYFPDLNTVADLINVPPSLADAEDIVHGISEEEIQAVLPGFYITITCRSPYKEAEKLVRDTFMKQLRADGRKPGTGYYIDKVYLITGIRLSAAGAQALGEGRRSRGTPSPVNIGPSFTDEIMKATAGDEYNPTQASMMDPITDEPMLNDWRFTIVASAVVRDYEPPVEAEGVGDDAGTAGDGG